MKSIFLFFIFLFSFKSFGQITIDYVDQYDDCYGGTFVSFGFTDVNNNPPYQARLLYGELDSNFVMDSAIYFTNSVVFDYLSSNVWITGTLLITSSAGDSTMIPLTLIYLPMLPIIIDNTPFDGTLNIGTGGGLAPFVYHLFADGTYVSSQSSSLFVGLPPSPAYNYYTAEVEDAHGCTMPNAFFVAGNGISACSQTVSAVTSDISCFQECDGTIVWSLIQNQPSNSYTMIIEGADNYYDSITLPPGMTTDTIYGLCKGQYTFRSYTDSACIDTIVFNVDGPSDVLDLTIDSFVTPAFGMNDGSIICIGSGGTSPYLYSLNGSVFQASGEFLNLSAGNYFIDVIDVAGCINTTSFYLDDNLSIGEEKTDGIIIYPNPSSEVVNVFVNGNYLVEIMDLKGSILFSTYVEDSKSIDVSAIPDGTYLLRFMNDNHLSIKKLIIE